MKRVFLFGVFICLSVFVVAECGDLVCDEGENESCPIDCENISEIADAVFVEKVSEGEIESEIESEEIESEEIESEEIESEDVYIDDEAPYEPESNYFSLVLWIVVAIVVLILLGILLWFLLRKKKGAPSVEMMSVVTVDNNESKPGSPVLASEVSPISSVGNNVEAVSPAPVSAQSQSSVQPVTANPIAAS